MNIEYFHTVTALDSIEVEDVGQCSIEACNDAGAFYYLIIKTRDGFTNILEYGPIVLDVKILPKSVICNYTHIEYDQRKVVKIIDTFLNNPKRNITQAREIDKEEALDNCRSLIQYMREEI